MTPVHSKKHIGKRGVSSLEIVIGTSIMALVVLFSTSAVVRFITEGSTLVDRTRATYLAEEGLEVARFLHDDGWANIEALSNGTAYHIDFSQNPVELTTTAALVEGVFTRTITFSAVERDNNDDIVPSGTPDSDTRLVTAEVSKDGMATVTLQTYLANIDNS